MKILERSMARIFSPSGVGLPRLAGRKQSQGPVQPRPLTGQGAFSRDRARKVARSRGQALADRRRPARPAIQAIKESLSAGRRASARQLARLGLLGLLGLCACFPGAREPGALDYILAPWLIEGLGRPLAPTDLAARYDAGQQTLTLDWRPAREIISGAPTARHRVYVYRDGPPREYYRPGDRLEDVATFAYATEAAPFSGALYFVVTGLQANTESAPSNVAALSLP